MSVDHFFFKRLVPAILSRPALQPINQLLFRLALSGMGVNNYNGLSLDEGRFLGRLKLAAGSIILDVGANEGQWATIARHHFPDARIHSFEPNPVTFGRLEATARRLGITAINQGCGDRPGTLTLYDASADAGSGQASFVPGVIAGAEIEARVTTLDDYCRDMPAIGLLKIDVEGFEAKVLAGAQETLRRTYAIQLEFDQMNLAAMVSIESIAALLPGFTLHRLLYNGALLPLTNAPPYRRNLFVYQNLVAIRG